MAVTDLSVTSRDITQHIKSVTHHLVSACTIRRRLQQNSLSARRPLLGLSLTQNYRRLRRQWCDERRLCAAEWNECVFTDESRICLQHHAGRIRVWRHRGERMRNSCVIHRHTGPAPAATPDQIWQRVEAALSAVPQEHIQSLFELMPRRVERLSPTMVATLITDSGRNHTSQKSIIAFVYYGISYNTNELAGDPFLNFAAYGIIEVPAYIVLIFVMRSKGRRNPLAFSLVASGIACLLLYPIPEDPWWASTAVSLFGKFCIACSFSIVYVCTAEIFPTTVRNVGLGTASVSARIGSIIAPFVRELGKATHGVVPQIIFGVLAGTGGLLALLLPEMTNRSVPDTLKEAAELSRKTCSKTKTDPKLAMQDLNKFKDKD
ncbi:organic cation transporter protein [Trichonephila clavipes]|nr:organic cation transporter protein [Trichonephila clavipes]